MTEAKAKTKAAAKKPKAAAKTATKTGAKTTAKKPPSDVITFRCQWCQQERPLEEMTRLARFSPVVIVCRSCARKIH